MLKQKHNIMCPVKAREKHTEQHNIYVNFQVQEPALMLQLTLTQQTTWWIMYNIQSTVYTAYYKHPWKNKLPYYLTKAN